MSMITLVRKIGFSIHSVIPPDVQREYDLRVGDALSWKLEEGGVRIVVTKVKRAEEQKEPVEAA
jgi:hypothetical protein